MQIYNFPQGSDEWLRARAGKVTASNFITARSKLKKDGKPTEAALNYAFRVAVESISGYPLDEGFETWAMRRGHEMEPEARAYYENITGNQVQECSFIATDCGFYGASADGLIGSTKGLEIKCLVSPEKIRDAILNYDISPWIDQVQGGMWITEREEWAFVIYCPALAGVNRELTVWNVQRDDAYIKSLVSDLDVFSDLVSEFREKLTQKAA